VEHRLEVIRRLREGEDNNEVGNKVVAHVRYSFSLHPCDCGCGRDDGQVVDGDDNEEEHK